MRCGGESQCVIQWEGEFQGRDELDVLAPPAFAHAYLYPATHPDSRYWVECAGRPPNVAARRRLREESLIDEPKVCNITFTVGFGLALVLALGYGVGRVI